MQSVPLRLAATAIPLRVVAEGFEVLMVRRNANLSFGGMWTFPGGGLEPSDGLYPSTIDEDEQDWEDVDLVRAARVAAAREAHEETGIECELDTMSLFSHWIPPAHVRPKRFATWFFLAPDVSGELVVDTTENSEARWTTAAAALRESADGGFPVAAPTWVTLDDLQSFSSIADLRADAQARGPRVHHTRAFRSDDGITLVWQGDSSYDRDGLARALPRNRLLMSEDGEVWARESDLD